MKGSIGQPTQLEGKMNITYRQYDKCPACNCTDKSKGGVLKFRRGKYGDFLGCSNYPECKYTTTRIYK